jgi:hypothetical protein
MQFHIRWNGQVTFEKSVRTICNYANIADTKFRWNTAHRSISKLRIREPGQAKPARAWSFLAANRSRWEKNNAFQPKIPVTDQWLSCRTRQLESLPDTNVRDAVFSFSLRLLCNTTLIKWNNRFLRLIAVYKPDASQAVWSCSGAVFNVSHLLEWSSHHTLINVDIAGKRREPGRVSRAGSWSCLTDRTRWGK